MQILLNPGPVNLSERVRNALLKPDLCHREIEFTRLQNDIRQKLLNVYGLNADDWAAILLTGSGTSAMEAMLISLVPEKSKVLIIENGVYGERLSRIAEIYHINFRTLHHEWDEQINLDKLEHELSVGFTHVAVVHHETTSGRLNDLDAIARICTAKQIPLLVDAVSSFAAEEIKFSGWNILACAATANKCLHSIPGTSFVIARRDVLERNDLIRRSLYLDLNTYLKQQDSGGTPFTQSIQSFYALNEALDEHQDEGGWKTRYKHYKQKMELVRTGIAKFGIETLLPEQECSVVLNAFKLPDTMDYEILHDALKSKGFVIYAGQGEFAKLIFRVAVMGTVSKQDIQRFLLAMEDTIFSGK